MIKIKTNNYLIWTGVIIALGWIVTVLVIYNPEINRNIFLILGPVLIGWLLMSTGIMWRNVKLLKGIALSIIIVGLLTYLSWWVIFVLSFVRYYGIS